MLRNALLPPGCACKKINCNKKVAKVRKKLAVIIYDKKYWNKILNFDALVELGMISKSDLSLFSFCDTIDEAFDAVVKHLKKYYSKEKEPKIIEPVLHLK